MVTFYIRHASKYDPVWDRRTFQMWSADDIPTVQITLGFVWTMT